MLQMVFIYLSLSQALWELAGTLNLELNPMLHLSQISLGASWILDLELNEISAIQNQC
jgi:hypothetical protein